MKYGFIASHRQQFRIRSMCRVLEVSPAGFYAWAGRGISTRQQADAQLLDRIRQVHTAHREAYGTVKTWRALEAAGISCGKHRVARLRRQAGIEARRMRRFRLRGERHFETLAAPDLIQRQFRAERPNQAWAGDMTYIPTREGWLHLAVLLDLCTARVVGWAMGDRPDESVALDALKMALEQRRPAPGLIHHTDRGVQYRARGYAHLIQRSGLRASMNATDSPLDNAAAESFFSTLKNELVHHRRFTTRNEARAAIFDYIEAFYNRQRLHQGIGYLTPLQAEQAFAVT